MGRGVINQLWGGHQSSMGGGGHQPSMGGGISQVWGVISQVWGGVINQLWGGASAKYGGVSIFPPVCTGTQNPENYFSNTYVLPSVNRTAGPIMLLRDQQIFQTVVSGLARSFWKKLFVGERGGGRFPGMSFF